jgi:hypothetical protein
MKIHHPTIKAHNATRADYALRTATAIRNNKSLQFSVNMKFIILFLSIVFIVSGKGFIKEALSAGKDLDLLSLLAVKKCISEAVSNKRISADDQNVVKMINSASEAELKKYCPQVALKLSPSERAQYIAELKPEVEKMYHAFIAVGAVVVILLFVVLPIALCCCCCCACCAAAKSIESSRA